MTKFNKQGVNLPEKIFKEGKLIIRIDVNLELYVNGNLNVFGQMILRFINRKGFHIGEY